jgi:holo-[acyl-carrier-protein] synthase
MLRAGTGAEGKKQVNHHIGTDIIEIGRIREAKKRYGSRFLHRVYTADEIKSYGHIVPLLAASFAGKEAVMKVLGTGARGVAWREIEVLLYKSGKPHVRLNGRAVKAAEKLGIKEIDISMSDSKEYATAVAIGSV